MDKGTTAMVIYGVINAWAGLLLLGVGIPFYLGRIKPNTWTGLRTDRTLSDPVEWYAANRTMGRDFMVAGAAILLSLAILLLFARRLTFTVMMLIHLGVIMVCVTWIVIHSLWTFRRRDEKQI
jgi:uncharacterized membrane protein